MSLPIELTSVLKLLPDTLRENPFGEGGLQLSPSQMDQLIAQSKVEMGEGYHWRLQYADDAHHHLQVFREGMEDGLRYELLRLPAAKKSQDWVLVLQGAEDHCCSYSRWALYEVEKGALIDRTQEKMPRLTWNDFFSDHALGDSPPPQLVENRYPFIMDLAASPPQILIGMSPDYLELNYPEEQVSGMLVNMPAWPKKLVWEEERFVWERD